MSTFVPKWKAPKIIDLLKASGTRCLFSC